MVICALAISLAAFSGTGNVGRDETPQAQEDVQVQIATQDEKQSKQSIQQVDEKEIVAKVNDEALIGEKYNTVLRSIQSKLEEEEANGAAPKSAEQMKKQALNTIVNQTLILQQAKEAKIEVTPSEIEEAYTLFVKQFEDEKSFNKELESKNVDIKTLKEQIAESLIYKKYQNEVVPVKEVTDKEIEAYYEQIVVQAKENGQFPPPLKEVSDEIKELVEQEKQQKLFAVHLEQLKKEASIELNI